MCAPGSRAVHVSRSQILGECFACRFPCPVHVSRSHIPRGMCAPGPVPRARWRASYTLARRIPPRNVCVGARGPVHVRALNIPRGMCAPVVALRARSRVEHSARKCVRRFPRTSAASQLATAPRHSTFRARCHRYPTFRTRRLSHPTFRTRCRRHSTFRTPCHRQPHACSSMRMHHKITTRASIFLDKIFGPLGPLLLDGFLADIHRAKFAALVAERARRARIVRV